jgi:hypothetical protein
MQENQYPVPNPVYLLSHKHNIRLGNDTA